ncbi:ankyrin repeat and SOCS box protein 15b isoform X1 [Poecilia reticulata]|uniref:ankyrin repeat and SOCS box protein 15b isoform X1 n=1 Tax=Poecilia reticulata TaxID=8081 RepID=UPI0007EAA037|nr:PREDICTED: ankyrin repeat and SOCS box protein 15 isoform X1 [Poecilia reticulata]
MDDLEQEGINEELIELAILESIQDAYKLRCSVPAYWKQPNSENFMKIMTAIDKGDVAALQELSCCASAFRESDSRGWLPLHAAAALPKTEMLHVVLQGNKSIEGFSPALDPHHPNCIYLSPLAAMASMDATLEERTKDGDTALTLAAEANQVENMKLLLRHGASPHNTNGRNESPLLLAVRQSSYDGVHSLIMGGAFVEQVCLTKWTATHEAAKVGCPAILMLLLRHGAQVTVRDGHGVTAMGIAAEHGRTEALEILIQHGGDVNARASNGDTVLYDASGSGNLDSVMVLLQHGANPNVASYACQLPIHRAAYEGHTLVLRTLIPVTTKRAIRLSGQSPVHSAADGGQTECLQLLIQNGFDINTQLDKHISENYGDLRKTPLYFAVSNGDVTCAEILLEAGARTDLDPLRCILVAIRAERYELVKLLLSYGAEVNCYFRVINNTVFPTALYYCLRDHDMLRLLLNSGYQAHKCFECFHNKSEDLDSTWTDLHNQAYKIYCQPNVIPFCEFVSVSWLAHLAGSVVRILLDYVSHISICSNLKRILERTPEWEEISAVLGEPRPLQHLCRLVIRGRMNVRTLNDPEAMDAAPFPPRLIGYLTYRADDPYGGL